MYNEFEKALSKLNNGKSEGMDRTFEGFRGSKGKHELFEICKQICNQWEWPEDLMESWSKPEGLEGRLSS